MVRKRGSVGDGKFGGMDAAIGRAVASDEVSTVKRWHGPIPEACDICERVLTVTFVDGATVGGPWAIMCRGCAMMHGRGIGTGRGQRYRVSDGVKIEG